MKKAVTILAFIILLSLLQVTWAPSAKAQNNPTYGNGVTIYSPCNRTYDPKEAIIVNASSGTLGGANVIISGAYTIDDGPVQILHTESRQMYSWDPFFHHSLIGIGKLPNLSEGQHKLTVYLKSDIEYTATKEPFANGEATVYFTVGSDRDPPRVTLDDLNGAVFNQTTVPLNFSINEPTSWIGYRLDNGTQTTITTNTNLTITPGNHNIIVYANDTSGNMGQSKVAYFTIQPDDAFQDALSETDIMIVAVFFCIMAIGAFLVILRTKNRNRQM